MQHHQSLKDTKFVGREVELAAIGEAYRWCGLGATQLILVKGESGIGKTTLVREAIRNRIIGNVRWNSVKFDLVPQDEPYIIVAGALRELIKNIILSDEWAVSRLKADLTSIPEPESTMLRSIVPEVGLLLREGELIRHIPPEETAVLVPSVFRRLLIACASRENPFILFLDDLQWADAETLSLMTGIKSDPQCQGLLVIGACRDEDLDVSHPLTRMLRDMEEAEVPVLTLELGPLPTDNVRTLMREALKRSDGKTDRLAEALRLRCGGNPFFIQEMLLSLQCEGYLRYEASMNQWEWEEGAGESAIGPVHLTDFLLAKLANMSQTLRLTLVSISCLRQEWDAELAAAACGLPMIDIGFELEAAIEGGYLIIGERPGTYRFAHDRLRQSAYALLTEERAALAHASVGLLLWERFQADEKVAADVFELVFHLNTGIHALPAHSQIVTEELIWLNERAGHQSKSLAAFASAYHYYGKGASMLTEDLWRHEQERCFNLLLEEAECAYLSGLHDKAERLLAALRDRAFTRQQKVQSIHLCTHNLFMQSKYDEAIEQGLDGLRQMGIHIPVQPSRLKLLSEYGRTLWRLRIRKTPLTELPEAADPEKRAMMELILLLAVHASYHGGLLASVLVARVMRMALAEGSTSGMPMAYTIFGIPIAMAGFPVQGRALAEKGVIMAERYRSPVQLGITTGLFNGYFSYTSKPLRDSFPMLRQAIDYGLAAGDPIYTAYNINVYTSSLLIRERPESWLEQLTPYTVFAARTGNKELGSILKVYSRFAEVLDSPLSVEAAAAGSLDGDGFNEQGFISSQNKQSGVRTLYRYYTSKIILFYLCGRYDDVLDCMDRSSSYYKELVHFQFRAEQQFYGTLAFCAIADRLSVSEMKRRHSWVSSAIHRFRKLSANCPTNFLAKLRLMEAETSRLEGKGDVAAELYDQAIRLGREQDYGLVEAIACELAGRFHESYGRTLLCERYIKDAWNAYTDWGATMKAGLLVETYPSVFEELSEEVVVRNEIRIAEEQIAGTVVVEENGDSLVTHAAEALGGTGDFRLSAKRLLLQIQVLTGAHKAALVQEHNGLLMVEDVVNTGDLSDNPTQPLRLKDCSSFLATGMIRYTAMSGETSSRNGLDQDDQFEADPYIRDNRNLSVICLPLGKKMPREVLYLEGDGELDKMSIDKLEALQLPATQVAFMYRMLGIYSTGASEEYQQGASRASLLNVSDSVAIPELSAPLTAREMEVLQGIAAGWSNDEIAERLGISLSTVKAHARQVFTKLKVRNRVSAVAQARQYSLLED